MQIAGALIELANDERSQLDEELRLRLWVRGSVDMNSVRPDGVRVRGQKGA